MEDLTPFARPRSLYARSAAIVSMEGDHMYDVSPLPAAIAHAGRAIRSWEAPECHS